MEATTAPAAPAQATIRAALYQLLDGIQDTEMLRAIWLLTSQVALAASFTEPEPELTPEQLAGLEEGIRQLDAGQGVPFAEVMARLQKAA